MKGKRRRVVNWKTHRCLRRSSQAQQESKTPECPTSPTPEGKGGDGRAWYWGVGADHRAPPGPMQGCVWGEQQEGRTEKPAALATCRGDLCSLGLFLPRVPAFTHVLCVYGKDC